MLSASEIRLLTEIGFVAAGRGWLDQARKIFNSLILLRPDRAFPYIGMGLALINAGQASEAVALLDRATAVLRNAQPGAANAALVADGLQDDRSIVTAYYGIALRFSGRQADSDRVFRDLSTLPSSDPAGRIARSMLGISPDTENL